MGKPKRPQYVKLIIGILAKNKKLFDTIEEFFVREFGEIDYRSPILLFGHTSYYESEMGQPLKRRFLAFKKLIRPERISAIKALTNSIEERFAIQKKGLLNRRINIDPGYVSDSKLVLATTKDYYHRIYLNKGIYVEVTLFWEKGGFKPFEWTYPDYKTPEYIDILDTIRNSYMDERRNGAG